MVEEMHHCDNSIQIRCDQIGAVTIPAEGELKDDIIDLVLGRMNRIKENLEDQFRMM